MAGDHDLQVHGCCCCTSMLAVEWFHVIRACNQPSSERMRRQTSNMQSPHDLQVSHVAERGDSHAPLLSHQHQTRWHGPSGIRQLPAQMTDDYGMGAWFR